MARQSHIYVIAFDSGTLKVGRAADVVGRLGTHRREAARHGVGVLQQWHSAPCTEGDAVLYERKLLALCASRGKLRAGAEYFTGVEFDEVQSLAESLAGAPQPPPAAKDRESAAKCDGRPDDYFPPYWKDGVEYVHEWDEFDDEVCPLVPPPPPMKPRSDKGVLISRSRVTWTDPDLIEWL